VPDIVSFGACFKKFHNPHRYCWHVLIRSKLVLFSVSGLKDEKLIDKKANLHANSILETFE